MNDNFQDKLLEKVLDDGEKDDKNIAKVLLLTTKLQEKYKKLNTRKKVLMRK